MSQQDLFDYVMNTPYNTNPAILKQKIKENSGVSSWNDLKDKPFYEETAYSNTLEWDGDTTGLLEDACGDYWLVSDYTPTIEQLEGATITYVVNGEEKSVIGDPCDVGNGLIDLGNALVLIAPNGDEWLSGEPFAVGKGIYFLNDSDIVVKSLTIPNYQFTKTTVKPLDGKYVKGMGYTETSKEVIFPETEFSFEHSISTQSEHRMVAGDFKLVVGNKYEVFFDGVKYECIAHSVYDDMGSVYLGTYNEFGEANFPFFVLYVEFPDYDVFFEKTIVFGIPSPAETVYHTFEIVGDVEIVHTIEPKYLPCDLMFKVGCTGKAHPNMNPANMTKPTIVSGSLEAVLEKLANGEIPVVKVQYMGVWDKTISVPFAYGGEFTCGTWLYNTSIVFDHFIACGHDQYSVRIVLDIDDPNFVEMQLHPCQSYMSPIIIID